MRSPGGRSWGPCTPKAAPAPAVRARDPSREGISPARERDRLRTPLPIRHRGTGLRDRFPMSPWPRVSPSLHFGVGRRERPAVESRPTRPSRVRTNPIRADIARRTPPRARPLLRVGENAAAGRHECAHGPSACSGRTFVRPSRRATRPSPGPGLANLVVLIDTTNINIAEGDR